MAEPLLDHDAHDHPHEHDRFCGHAVVPHDDHVDFLHDGHVHHRHDDHVDDVDAAEGVHPAHVGHMHVHGPGCGHPTVIHAEHEDYMHGIHRHVAHGSHYDEH